MQHKSTTNLIPDGNGRETMIPVRDTSLLREALLWTEEASSTKDLLPAPFELFTQFDQYTISNFCLENGYYGLPIWQLIDWLNERIDNRLTIEVASGHGALASGLSIRATDSKIQDTLSFKANLDAYNQHPVRYGSNVEQMEASAAVRHYKPEVVVASWATQKWKPGYRCGFTEGVDFLDILNLKYVREIYLIGNQYIHGKMEMVKKTCVAEVKFPYLVSRSTAIAMNRIYILRKK